MITSFCKKGLHSFLGFTNLAMDNPPCTKTTSHTYSSSPPPCSNSHGVGLVTATDEMQRPPNVLESSSVKSSSSSPPNDVGFIFFNRKKDREVSGSIFLDDLGGGVVVDGLMSCTESLGFESSDERNDQLEDIGKDLCSRSCHVGKTKWREESVKRREKKYPPPLTSLNHKGQRSFILKPVRTNGRLELTEVRLDRPEILRASREDGRLKLEFITEEEDEEEVLEEEEVEEEEDKEEMELGRRVECFGVKNIIGELKFQLSKEGIGRCHDMVNHHHLHLHSNKQNHHQILNVWRHCVPTR